MKPEEIKGEIIIGVFLVTITIAVVSLVYGFVCFVTNLIYQGIS